MSRLITLLTDFGVEEVYAGAMKGVIWSLNPQALIVDLTHSVEPQNVLQAAFLLHTAYPFYPPDTIHLAVVDPGVGSERRAIALKVPAGIFVAPDNGLLSYIIDRIAEPPQEPAGILTLQQRRLKPPAEAVVLTEPRFWRQRISPTFHGRDLFAPVAAHLSLSVPLDLLGESTAALLAFSLPTPRLRPDGAVEGRILHIDRFGNLISDLPQEQLPEGPLLVEVGGVQIEGLVHHYAEGGEMMALVGSSGYLEVAARNASAKERLRVRIGEAMIVRPRGG